MHKFINYKRAVHHYESFMNRMKFNINTKFYFLVGYSCMFILLLIYWLSNIPLVFFIGMIPVFDFCVVNRDVSFYGDKL